MPNEHVFEPPPPAIIRAGHPVLRRVASPVADPTAPDIVELATGMARAMMAAAGVGLAAPQIAVSRRLIVFWVPERRTGESPDDRPIAVTALVNPEFTPLEPTLVEDWEGCLSIPGLRGRVPRFEHIRYRGFGLGGELIERVASGFHARVVQHEIDHLEGVLYPSRMTDLGSLGFNEEIAAAALAAAETTDRMEPENGSR